MKFIYKLQKIFLIFIYLEFIYEIIFFTTYINFLIKKMNKI